MVQAVLESRFCLKLIFSSNNILVYPFFLCEVGRHSDLSLTFHQGWINWSSKVLDRGLMVSDNDGSFLNFVDEIFYSLMEVFRHQVLVFSMNLKVSYRLSRLVFF